MQIQSTVLRFSVLLGVPLLAGCLSPFTTRFPTWEPGHPPSEKKAYQLHDPFPDVSAGPDTQVRPRGYDIQRTAPRRAIEGRMLQGVQPQLGPGGQQPPPIGPTGGKYPNAVPY